MLGAAGEFVHMVVKFAGSICIFSMVKLKKLLLYMHKIVAMRGLEL